MAPNLGVGSREEGWLQKRWGSVGGSDGKESVCTIGRSPGGGHGNSFQCSCLENLHGQRSLVGYSPWGHKESDTTECLTLSLSL